MGEILLQFSDDCLFNNNSDVFGNLCFILLRENNQILIPACEIKRFVKFIFMLQSGGPAFKEAVDLLFDARLLLILLQ